MAKFFRSLRVGEIVPIRESDFLPLTQGSVDFLVDEKSNETDGYTALIGEKSTASKMVVLSPEQAEFTKE